MFLYFDSSFCMQSIKNISYEISDKIIKCFDKKEQVSLKKIREIIGSDSEGISNVSCEFKYFCTIFFNNLGKVLLGKIFFDDLIYLSIENLILKRCKNKLTRENSFYVVALIVFYRHLKEISEKLKLDEYFFKGFNLKAYLNLSEERTIFIFEAANGLNGLSDIDDFIDFKL